MSCLATFYVLPEAQRVAFMTAKERVPRVEVKKMLFFKVKKPVAGEQVWEFLDRVSVEKTELEFSGFLLVDYLFVYPGNRGAVHFDHSDENSHALSPGGADKLATFLRAHPVDRAAIENYLKKDGRPLGESEREATLDAYEESHASLLAWCASIQPGTFGVLYLSF